jgi:hypothetical protein
VFVILKLYSLASVIKAMKARRMRWAGHVSRMGEKRNAYRLLVAKPEGRRLLERTRRRWLDNIKMDLVEVGWGDVGNCGMSKQLGISRVVLSSMKLVSYIKVNILCF